MSEYKLIGHETYLEKFVTLYENNELPNKILLKGQKGIRKSTLAYHLINFVQIQLLYLLIINFSTVHFDIILILLEKKKNHLMKAMIYYFNFIITVEA